MLNSKQAFPEQMQCLLSLQPRQETIGSHTMAFQAGPAFNMRRPALGESLVGG